jgi:hypothetical protein
LKSKIAILSVLGITIIAFGCKQTPISPEMIQELSELNLADGTMKMPNTTSSKRPILIDQGGRRMPIWALRGHDSVQDFYQYNTPNHSSSNTADDLEISGTSQIFFYFDTNNEKLSLIIIHDRPNDGSGGLAQFDFSGLPLGTTIKVKDDPGDYLNDPGEFFLPPQAMILWGWLPCCTDGGAFGGLDNGFDITINAAFPPKSPGEQIDTWVARSLRPNGKMELIELDMDKPLRLFRPGKK